MRYKPYIPYRPRRFIRSIRFKGIVMEQYRDALRDCFIFGTWNASDEKIFSLLQTEGGYEATVPFVPLELPKEWIGIEAFRNSINMKTGEWVFTCTIYDKEKYINFMDYTLPFIIEEDGIETCEVWKPSYKNSTSKATTTSKTTTEKGVVTKYYLQDFKWKELK